MPEYRRLIQKLADREVVILNGAIGTEIERLGVEVQDGLQCAMATETDPDIVRRVHENYIRAGAQIITANTSVAGREYLSTGGLGQRSDALNRRSVELALEAREAVDNGPVWIAGAISTYGIGICENEQMVRTDFARQAGILSESGADLLLLEVLGCDAQTAVAAMEEASKSGLPVWVALSWDPDGSSEEGKSFGESAAEIAAIGGEAYFIFHTPVELVREALRQLRERVNVPVGVYPHCGGSAALGEQSSGMISPPAFLESAKTWVSDGAQIVGGCCGIGLDHIRLLGERLPHSTR